MVDKNVSCRHIVSTHLQKDGMVIYDKGHVLQLCDKCVEQIVVRYNSRVETVSEEISFSEYQEKAKKTAIFPNDKAVEYLTLGLVGEAGEVANKVKKILRGDYELEEIKEPLIGELGDIFWYLAMLVDTLGTSFDEIAKQNLEKLAKRQTLGMIQGSGDDREKE